ncbi:hypothetical protein [Hylemonella gracilis]|uniref:hypothetical protein n=1 Tax=Hylemonella gracilis TaxID=80880 RepID=UPI00054F71FC|nr:hypothetical protein [Hylemonella gracilis]
MTTARPQYQPVGRCIYCGSKLNLSNEHIIPYALDGLDVLPKSSCRRCSEVTSKIEGKLTQQMWGQFRAALNSKSRTKKWTPETPHKVSVIQEGVRRTEIVPTRNVPAVLIMPVLPMPAIITGKQVTDYTTKNFVINTHQLEDWQKQHVLVGAFDLEIFCRSLAKIAHAYLCAQIGVDNFKPVLPPAILGEIGALHFVGSPPEDAAPLPSGEDVRHVMAVVDLSGDVSYVGVLMRLFSNFGAPEFLVVGGNRN